MQNNPPQIGIDFNKGRQAKAEWKQAVAKAADNVAFWDAVSGIINQQSAEQTTQEAQPIAQQENATEQAEQPSQESVAENAPIAEPSATEQESFAPQIAEEQPTNEDITPEEDARREPLRQRAKVWEEKTGVKVVLIENEAEIEQESARREVAKSKVMGWYDRKSGKVYLYMPNLMSEEEIDQTFIHEVVIHKGLRGLLKEKAYNKVMRRVFRNMTPEQQSKWKRYPGVNGDIIKAADEFIAHSFETLEVENQSLWHKFIDAIRTALINMGLPLRGPLSMSDATLSSLIRRSYRKMANERAMDVPDVIQDNETGQAAFSIKTYEKEGRENLQNFVRERVEQGALTQDQANEIIDEMELIYNACAQYSDKYVPFGAWSEAEVTTDSRGFPVFSVIKSNGDYNMNLDFSLVCKKRRTLDAVFEEMINRGIIGTFDLGQVQIAAINDIIRKNGFETACRLCFVDSKRFRTPKVADNFAELYNSLVDMSDSQLEDVIKGETKETVKKKAAKHLLSHPEDRIKVGRENFITANGFEQMYTERPGIMKLYNMAKGSGGPKASLGDVQYLNDVQNTNWTPEKAYSVGGVRLQSFSDYVPRMVFDYVQLIGDLAAKKLPVHAYTKEPIFAKQFGLTGIKINLSLVPRVDADGIAPGLDANGDYVWQEGETFPFEEAIALQNAEGYKENVGTIAVGVSDAHISKMLDDPNIRMVIPYHKSGLNKEVAIKNNIDAFQDYTNSQNTRNADGTKASKADLNGMPDFNQDIHSGMSPREAAQHYLDWCDSKGLLPKFDQFRDNPNYYKLLEDFTTIIPEGEGERIVPQRQVEMHFPTQQDAFGSMESLIKEGLEEDALLEGRRQSEVGNIVDEVTQYLANESSADDDIAFSTSTEIDELYPNWLEGTTTDSGKHSTQVEGTRKTYGKVGTWIEENLGKDVAILDASSGMGYGTADLRERGFNIEDVEPYQSEERKQNNPATYSSYADIRKQYDYIISNAVLNVIPDDWRSNVLHDMANRLKTGGRMFINTRKAGEEKSIKDKIELDSPQEVLVKRNGRIASYQRFFTPQELKSWVEEELGEGYSVEIANEKNSGTKGLAAVVVTKTKLEDNQGNPIDENGKLIVEQVSSINEITDADFERPTRSIQLPAIPKNVDAAIGANGKPVIIKKNVFEKNKRAHKDLRPVDGRMILTDVLYNSSLYGQNQKASRPYNWILIHLAEKNSAIIIEINESKDNLEIINWHYLSDETLERKKRQAIREGGLILALDSAVANTPNDLSPRKDSNSASNMQENSEDIAFSIIGEQGTTVTRRKADIAVKLQGRDVSPTQLKVLDAFTTDANNITIDVVDANGEQRSITLKQGQDNRAGVKHSVLRHYETAKNSYTAEDILLIPQVVEQGERKQDGKKVSYKLDIGGVKYTVTTDIKGNHEEFTNFFTNRKPIVEEQGSSNTANQHEQPQQSVSANEGSDNISPLQENPKNSDDIAFSIIGEKGASALDRADEVTHRMDNLNIAREMETTGKDAKAIRLATGWERGADGKWRYEIEDIEIKNLEPLIDGKYATLGDVVDGTIFQAYPQLKDIPIDTNTSNGDSGSYDSSFHVSKGTIELGEDFIRSVLVHEIQHAIQSIEGWSGGKPSPNDKFFNEMRDRHKVIMDILSNDYNEAELRNLIKQEQDKAKRLIYFEMYEFMRDGMSMDDIRKFYMDEYDSLDRRQREARKEYLNASGEVESRNAQKRMDMSNEQRRETLLADTEDVAREDQIFLMENSGDSEMAEGNLFQYFAGTLSELISRAKASAQGLIKKVIAPVSSRLKDDLAQQGVELDDNYKHVIDNNAIRHTLNNHSGSSEEKRGQIPVTESDFDRIEDVVENYDSIVVDNGKRGNINILYSKTYADGTTIYIEEKRNKRKELAMVTMWKMKNSTLTDANRSETTPIPDLNEVSTGKDTTTSSNTQQNGELFKRGDIYDYKTGDKITMQNVNVALYREHGPYGQALKQNVSFRGVVLGWGKDYQIDAERLNENLDKALIILEEYKEHLTSLKSNATTPAQKVIDEQIAKIDASMDWANQTKENPSLFHERWHNAPFLELLRPIAEEVVNAEFPDNPSVVAQQTAEALGVDIEIDETLPAKGSYNTRTGRIRINPHRHSSPQDIERTILHEVIGHGGLQALSKHRMPHTKEVLTKKTAQKIAQYNF